MNCSVVVVVQFFCTCSSGEAFRIGEPFEFIWTKTQPLAEIVCGENRWNRPLDRGWRWPHCWLRNRRQGKAALLFVLYAQALKTFVCHEERDDFASARIRPRDERIEIAARDSGESTVTSGLPDALNDAANLLRTGEYGASDD